MGKLLNRDSLTLTFDWRVAYEGTRSRHPLGSRVEFFGIAFSNLREFMQVRYPAAITEYADMATDIEDIKKDVTYAYANINALFKAFNQKHEIVRMMNNLTKKDRDWADQYFRRNVFPALLPITVDSARQANIHTGLYILVVTSDGESESIGYIEVPTCMPRFIRVPDKPYVIPIENLIQYHLKEIFHVQKIMRAVPFSITRSAEIYITTDRYTDPFQLIKDTLKERENSWVTLLEVGSKDYVKKIRKILQLDNNTLVLANRLIKLSDLKTIPSEIYSPKEKPRRFTPYPTFQTDDVFEYIKKKDRLCFHPFESYDDSVVRFIEQAAVDPNVMSIRIALYRVSARSRIVDALMKAADNGKLVTALIELKARFDEKHNMEIATIMREGGVRIVYTNPDIKTHAKLCLVTRTEKRGLRIYSHIATGNYSEQNSRVYTDYSYFTADQRIGTELTKFFNLLTADQDNFKSKRVIYAPYNLKSTIVDEINEQIKRAKDKKTAQIIIKCNALTDPGVAERLQDAAKAGVKIKLIVRTACIISPQKNIEVYSIVGQFLEHSRVYVFGCGKKATVYIGSADMMTRNLARRNELLILVENRSLKLRIMKHIQWYLTDTENRWIMKPKNKIDHISNLKKSGKKVDCHQLFRKEAWELADKQAPFEK